jgi:hypothetical protein
MAGSGNRQSGRETETRACACDEYRSHRGSPEICLGDWVQPAYTLGATSEKFASPADQFPRFARSRKFSLACNEVQSERQKTSAASTVLLKIFELFVSGA